MARRARRRTEWIGALASPTTLGADSSVLVTLLSSDSIRQFAGAAPTIVRIRGMLSLGLNITPDTATHTALVTAGLRCIHDEVTAAPNLFTAAVLSDEDWMWIGHSRLDAMFQTRQYWNGSTAVDYSKTWRGPLAFKTWELDVRAMRKAPDPCALQLVLRNTALNGTPDIQFTGLFRVLVKQTP